MLIRFLLLAFAIILPGCGRPSPESDLLVERASESAAQVVYQCESGRRIEASYPSDSTAVVEYGEQTLQMSLAVSASGARYVGGGLEWWTKGTWPGYEGTLFRHESGGTTGEIVEQCEQITDRSVRK